MIIKEINEFINPSLENTSVFFYDFHLEDTKESLHKWETVSYIYAQRHISEKKYVAIWIGILGQNIWFTSWRNDSLKSWLFLSLSETLDQRYLSAISISFEYKIMNVIIYLFIYFLV